MQVVLFDIDGTLIRAGGAGREALARGAARAFGMELDEVRARAATIDFRGRIDPHLVDELTRACGLLPGPRDGALMAAYLDALPETLRAAPYEVLPGVPALLERLRARPRTGIGLLTGNVRAGARIKLAHGGLDALLDGPGGFGDDGADRFEVARAGVARALAAGAASAFDVIVVGDTEHDVATARAAGARAVAVGTGWTPREVLERSAPQLFLEDLARPDALLELLDA